MIYEVVVSDPAIETLVSIKAQIEGRWGLKYVVKFEERVAHLLDVVQGSPFIFKSINFDPNIRKALVHKNCSMFYENK